jgi:tRNA(Ile)-lysidine synthase
MESVLRQDTLWPGAVAVSGGGDSLALMVMLGEWARVEKRDKPVVLTVDHGLAPGSDGVAADVAAKALRLGLDANVLKWQGRKPVSDIEGTARAARYRLMGTWCRANNISALYVAHSLEDQAETFLARLARGSGVDGLAAMRAVAEFPLPGFGGLRVVRPLLPVPRARLRALLSARGLDWHEDAMNTDLRFARSRLRALLPQLAAAGLSPERIADAAKHLARARAALDHDVSALLVTSAQRSGKFVLLDGAALAAAPREVGLRVIARLLMQVSEREYRPRFERLEGLYDAICTGSLGGGRTLLGCVVKPAPKRHQSFGPRTLLISPEPSIRGGY